jgi:hypothetical protein
LANLRWLHPDDLDGIERLNHDRPLGNGIAQRRITDSCPCHDEAATSLLLETRTAFGVAVPRIGAGDIRRADRVGTDFAAKLDFLRRILPQLSW